MFVFSMLLGCPACVSCQPSLPLDNNTEETQEPSQETQDTSDDTAEDTAWDPPPCPVMEVEPNGTYENAQWVPMEQWVCGSFDSPTDLDVFDFDFPQEGWLKIWVRAQDLGSSADTLVSIKSGTQTALSTFYLESTDPIMVVPVSQGGTIQAAIQEQYNGYGENQFWEALFSESKPPVEYNMIETTISNNAIFDGQAVEDGDRVLGIIDSNFDRDWYLIELDEGLHTMTFSIEANAHGSPLDAMLYLYPPETFEDLDTNYVKYRNHGLNPNSTDPYLTYTTSKAGVWGVQVKPYNNSGSDFYWYLLDVKVE